MIFLSGVRPFMCSYGDTLISGAMKTGHVVKANLGMPPRVASEDGCV